MEFDAARRLLHFESDEELAAFHTELTKLLREVTITVSGATKDAELAMNSARQVLREFQTVARILSALRKQARPERAGD